MLLLTRLIPSHFEINRTRMSTKFPEVDVESILRNFGPRPGEFSLRDYWLLAEAAIPLKSRKPVGSDQEVMVI